MVERQRSQARKGKLRMVKRPERLCQVASDRQGLLSDYLVGHLKLDVRERSVTMQAMGRRDGEKTRLKGAVSQSPIELLRVRAHQRLRGWKN